MIGGDTVGRDKFITNVTNIYGDESRSTPSGKTFKQEQVFVQFVNAIHRSLAEKQAVVAFIDDLQWADVSSLRLLFHLAQNLETGTILFIGAFRAVDALQTTTNADMLKKIRAELLARHVAEEIVIREGILVKDYATQRYPNNAFPSYLIDQIQEQTEGHALYVSALFTLWQEQGVIRTNSVSAEEARWVLSSNAATLEIPKELSEVLQQLIQLMSDELKDVLKIASVEGEDFTAQVVARLRHLGANETFNDLAEIEERYRLIQEAESQEVAAIVLDFYRFVHRFFREHIYKKMKSGQRRIFHQQVGEYSGILVCRSVVHCRAIDQTF